MPGARTPGQTVRTDDVALRVATFGRGLPVTLFAHGLAGTIGETRTLASGVPGTRAFLHFRGHGGTRPLRPDLGWGYAALAADLRAAADAVGATRAVGVSMGAGALLRLLGDTPDRFTRLVFFLPNALDRPRDDVVAAHYATLVARVEARDRAEVTAVLLNELPPPMRFTSSARAWAEARAVAALAGADLGPLIRRLSVEAPLASRAMLARVVSPSLVLAQERDPLHPVDVARQLCDALPAGRLEVFAQGAALWTERARLRRLVSSFLAP